MLQYLQVLNQQVQKYLQHLLLLQCLFLLRMVLYILYTTNAAGAVTGLTVKGMMVAMVGLNLAMAGIQQMMMPDPSVDKDTPESYLFNGNQRSIAEGDPVPILYGELRVPGRPIGFEILNETIYYGSSQGGGPHGGLHNIGGSPGHVTQQLD